MTNSQDRIAFIWSIAELLRGDYKQSDYGKVVLPFTVLRRLDCVLQPRKAAVLAKLAKLKGTKFEGNEAILNQVAGLPFHNASKLDFEKLKGDSNHLAANLKSYINHFSTKAREVVEAFNFEEQIQRLDKANLLFKVLLRFCEVDLSPDAVPNHSMGHIFEELIRRFSEQSNETAGEHFTPREVIRLMVNVLFVADDEVLAKKGAVRTLYDPACGTGGMLSVADEHVHSLNSQARLEVFGQEINPESYGICCSDMMIKGYDPANIQFGNTFTDDALAGRKFDYMLTNPPFGVDWKKYEEPIRAEKETLGWAGRFGAGLPRINDGSLLFLQHMLSKMKPENGGSRLAIVFNGSPLFTGDAGSGESEIRKWIIENDWLEAIIGLPDQLFYNTGISTYIWVLTNRKAPERRGKVQLINAVSFSEKMRKSLGQKRNEISEVQIDDITRIYGEFENREYCKVFDNRDFGYRRITVERPLRLNFQTSPERIGRVREQTAFMNLARSKKKGAEGKREEKEGAKLQERIIAVLQRMEPGCIWKNRDEFTGALNEKFEVAGVKVPGPVRKALIEALSERDETADICQDSDGNPEPDPALRDYENVPLKGDVDDYMQREVLPHVADAWVDHDKTKVGYEIPFTRHFYKYEELRPVEDITAEIRSLEDQIQAALSEALL